MTAEISDATLFIQSLLKDWEAIVPKCVNCDHPVQLAIYAWDHGRGWPPEPNTWTHGIGRLSGFWQGVRCPRRMTGATPREATLASHTEGAERGNH